MICLIRMLSSAGPSVATARVWLRGDQSVSVGRQEGSDLWVSDPHMSRHHLVIEGFGAGFRLRDLDSRNGTKLNGVMVTVATLHTGDSIRAGTTTLEIEFCAERHDTFGPDSTSRLDDGSGQLSRTASGSDSQRQQFVAPKVDQGEDRTKLSDDETQWVIDDAITSALVAVSPAVAALGVHHVGSDNAFTETGIAEPLSNVCFEEPTGDSLASSDQQPSKVRDRGQNNHGLQTVPSTVESATASPQPYSPESVSASVDNSSLPEGLEGFKLQRLPDYKTGGGFVLRQAGARAIDLCEHLGQFYRLLLVVNRSQLDPTCAGLLDYLVEQGSATAVTQTIYRIDGDTASVPLLQLMRRASRRDAAVCLGFRYTDSDAHSTIAELSHLVCYPSLLFKQLTRLEKDDHQSHSLFKKVVFFLFEKDLTGDLYLFAERGFRPAGTLVK